jgi:hypothetical protein
MVRALSWGCASLVFGVASIGLTGTGWAGGPAKGPTSTYPAFYGYLDIHGGYDTSSDSGLYDFDDHYSYKDTGSNFGGSGHASAVFSPNWSAQIGAWASSWQGTETSRDEWYGDDKYHYSNSYWGVGGHLTWRNLGGILLSYGGERDWGNFGTIGVEAFHDYGNWRVYGQVGYTSALSGSASDFDARDWYGEAVASYYFNPNLALSGNFGVDRHTEDFFDLHVNKINWGARLEYKLPNLPISTYVAYQGWHWSGSDGIPDHWHGTENTIVAGLRILFGGDTLRENARNVGLLDMNPIYGEDFPH